MQSYINKFNFFIEINRDHVLENANDHQVEKEIILPDIEDLEVEIEKVKSTIKQVTKWLN